MEPNTSLDVNGVPSCIAKCRCSTDVSLKSSDGRVYGFHIDTLKDYGRFKIPVRPPGPRSKKPPAAIEMAETSDVLVILLNFMHLKKQMDLKNLDFSTLLPFARAAEKYKVYPALNICSILLRNCIPDHPVEVLMHAIQYGHHDLRDRAAPYTICTPLEMCSLLIQDRDMFLAWVRYRERWRTDGISDRFQKALTETPGGLQEAHCPQNWAQFVANVQGILEFGDAPPSVEAFDEAVITSKRKLPSCCKLCDAISNQRGRTYMLTAWRDRIVQVFKKSVPFEWFLGPVAVETMDTG